MKLTLTLPRIQSVLGALLLLSSSHSAEAASEHPDEVCRSITSKDEPIATADVVLVGSGPGGAGFLYRFVRQRPDLSVIWIEKGLDFKALNWPEDIAAVNKEVLTAFPRKAMTWITGYGKYMVLLGYSFGLCSFSLTP